MSSGASGVGGSNPNSVSTSAEISNELQQMTRQVTSAVRDINDKLANMNETLDRKIKKQQSLNEDLLAITIGTFAAFIFGTFSSSQKCVPFAFMTAGVVAKNVIEAQK